MLQIVVGSAFAGKRLWVDREIETREAAGEVGTVALDFTSLYSAVVPGLASVYRDERITDTGAARFAGWMLAAAVREANERELTGFVLTDSPRRAVALAAAAGDAPLVEVVVSQETAVKRSREHVELVKALAPRAAADNGAAERCRKMVEQYYREADVLPAERRRVTAPDVPSARAVTYAWEAALKAAKGGDEERKAKWIRAAKAMLKRRGVAA